MGYRRAVLLISLDGEEKRRGRRWAVGPLLPKRRAVLLISHVGGEERRGRRWAVGPLLPKRRAVLLSLDGGEKRRVRRWAVGPLPKRRAVLMAHRGIRWRDASSNFWDGPSCRWRKTKVR